MNEDNEIRLKAIGVFLFILVLFLFANIVFITLFIGFTKWLRYAFGG